MTVGEIKQAVMFQTNNDAEDMGDFQPFLLGYVNDGYDRLVYAFHGAHTEPGSPDFPPLEADADVPNLPAWIHQALADWATWMVYRNGNPQKQNRGYAFRASFDETLQRVVSGGGAGGRTYNFFNIP